MSGRCGGNAGAAGLGTYILNCGQGPLAWPMHLRISIGGGENQLRPGPLQSLCCCRAYEFRSLQEPGFTKIEALEIVVGLEDTILSTVYQHVQKISGLFG